MDINIEFVLHYKLQHFHGFQSSGKKKRFLLVWIINAINTATNTELGSIFSARDTIIHVLSKETVTAKLIREMEIVQ